MDRSAPREALQGLIVSPAGPTFLRYRLEAVQAKVGDDGIEALRQLGAVERVLEYEGRGRRTGRIAKPAVRRVRVLDVPRAVLRNDL